MVTVNVGQETNIFWCMDAGKHSKFSVNKT